jgi:hypothetical protein
MFRRKEMEDGLKRNTKNSLKALKFSERIGFKSKTTSEQGLAPRPDPTLKSFSANFKGRRNLRNC